MSCRRSPEAAACLILFLVAAPAARAEFGSNITVGYSDNIARTSSGEVTDSIVAARVGGETGSAGGNVEGEVSWELGAIEYLDNTFDDELLAVLDGNADFELSERRVFWSFTDQLAQQAVEPFVAVTPESTEYVNFFTSGPRFVIPMNRRIALDLSLAYGNVWYEEQDLDNDRRTGSAGLRFAPSPISSVTLYAVKQDYAFENPLYTDYDQQQLYVEYSTERERGDLRVAVGDTEVEGAGISNTSEMLELEWSRRVSAYGQFAFSASKGLSDSGEVFQLGSIEDPGIGTENIAVNTSEPIELQYLSLRYSIDRPRTYGEVNLRWVRQGFETLGTEPDNEVPYLETSLSRELTPRFRVELSATYSEQRFIGDTRVDYNRGAAITFGWNIGRRTFVDFQVMRVSRASSGSGPEFEEHRAFVTFNHGVRLSQFQMGI